MNAYVQLSCFNGFFFCFFIDHVKRVVEEKGWQWEWKDWSANNLHNKYMKSWNGNRIIYKSHFMTAHFIGQFNAKATVCTWTTVINSKLHTLSMEKLRMLQQQQQFTIRYIHSHSSMFFVFVEEGGGGGKLYVFTISDKPNDIFFYFVNKQHYCSRFTHSNLLFWCLWHWIVSSLQEVQKLIEILLTHQNAQFLFKWEIPSRGTQQHFLFAKFDQIRFIWYLLLWKWTLGMNQNCSQFWKRTLGMVQWQCQIGSDEFCGSTSRTESRVLK